MKLINLIKYGCIETTILGICPPEESRPPSVDRSRANLVWRVYGYGYGSHNFAALSHFVIPSIYLKTNVIIESGNGSSSNPYILKLGN